MATTLKVNWSAAGGQNSGTGTTPDPYGSIDYALAQQVIAQPNLATLGGLIIEVDDTANTGCPANDNVIDLGASGLTNSSTTNFVTITAGANKRPTSTGPQLEVVMNTTGACWSLNLTGATVDGFYFHHNNTGVTTNPQLVDSNSSDAIKVKNCKFFADSRAFGSSTRLLRLNTNAIVENCLFIGGRNWIDNFGGSSTATVRNCTFVASVVDVGAGQIQMGTSLAMYNCAVYAAGGAALQAGITGNNNAIDAASTQGQAGVWSIQNLTTAAFVNYAGGDYRLVSGSPLIDVGSATAGQFSTTDMFGTTRSSPDIGFHEFVGSGATASGAGVEDAASAPAGSAATITATINLTLRSKTGAIRASETGITALVYKNVPSSNVAPDKRIAGVSSNGSGVISISVSDIGLSLGQAVWLILLRDGTDAGARKVTPDYT